MAKYQFPRNPGVRPENLLADEQGKNRFADEAPATSTDDNPFSPSLASDVQPYKPEGYETFLPHRGGLIFTLGGIGLAVVSLGVIGAFIAAVGTGEWQAGIFLFLPLHLLGLAFALPAWIMGRSDLQAIHAGAMDGSGRRGTVAGLAMGIAGTLLGVLPVLTFFALLGVGLLGW